MTNSLADRLMRATDLDAFLKDERAGATRELFSLLKAEVDRLVGSDLNAAALLVDCIERLSTREGSPVALGFASACRARVLHSSGKYSDSLIHYGRALESMRLERLRTEAASILIHQVFALTQMGRYSEALAAGRAARRMLSTDDTVRLAQLETNTGNIYFRMDRYGKALQHYDRAHDLFSQTGDKAMLAFVDFSRSNVFSEMDLPQEAEMLLDRAASSWEEAGRALLAAQARFEAAYLQFLRGNYKTALARYYQARERVAELGSAQLAAWCDIEIAEILFALNSFDDAAVFAARAREEFTALGMPYEAAKGALTLALIFMMTGKLDQARSDLLESRGVFRASGNTIFSAQADAYLAELALRAGDAAEASDRSSAALRVFARHKLVNRAAYSRLLVARSAYLSGDRRKAARMTRTALRLGGPLVAQGVAYQCHHLLGRIEQAAGERKRSLASFRKAVEIIEQMRGGVAADELKANFLRDKISVYEDAIGACLDEGSMPMIEEAFRYVEASKSRALADLLVQYAGSPPVERPQKPAPQDENRARLSRLIQELNWYNSQAGLEDEKGSERSADAADRYHKKIIRREKQVAQLFQRIEVEDPELAYLHGMAGASVHDLCSMLEEGEQAIEYFTTHDDVSAFIASPSGIEVVRGLVSKRVLEQKLAALRFQLEKFSYGPGYIDDHFWQLKAASDQVLTDVYHMVFAPLERWLKADRLIIIPHGALHYVPFQALCDSQGYYLIDRFEITSSPSASVLKVCRERKKKRGRGYLVALGVSEKGTPGIDKELGALRGIFPDAILLAGNEATHENLMRHAPRARFLHLASHGYFRRDNPMFSFLKLADTRLNFYNLLDLRLRAEVVTLSACHTGVNTVFPGDELHGLMRGFLHAGAPALVVSLWAVNDDSTAELMREMYSHLRAGRSKREALRLAQLHIKEAFGHPYYWAPFVLMGNPK